LGRSGSVWSSHKCTWEHWSWKVRNCLQLDVALVHLDECIWLFRALWRGSTSKTRLFLVFLWNPKPKEHCTPHLCLIARNFHIISSLWVWMQKQANIAIIAVYLLQVIGEERPAVKFTIHSCKMHGKYDWCSFSKIWRSRKLISTILFYITMNLSSW